jgi:chitodextrinase
MTTTNITWAWGTNTHIKFNPATDVLNFGWFAADQFTIGEVNGSVVIAIPPNHQTYTLDNVTLSELHLSDIVANDSSAISEWQSVLSTTTTTPPPAPPPPVTPPVVTPPVTPPATGAQPWSATEVYIAGMTATENGVTYEANWWVQGVDPVQHSSMGNSGEPWTIIGGGNSEPSAWLATKVYTAGMEVAENGTIYEANWWTEGSDPSHNNGGNGAGEPWTVLGPVDPTHAVPSVPTGLAADATSTTATTLSWHASTVPVTDYAVFENGHEIATTTNTSYMVTELTADTAYQFSVTAIDAAGSSAQSSPLSVITQPVATPPPSPPPSSGGHTHEFSPYIDMAMSQDDNLLAIFKASGIENFTLAFVLASDHGIGWQGTGTISQDTLVNGSTILQQVQAIQAAGGDITISFGGAAGQEAALTATSANALQADIM